MDNLLYAVQVLWGVVVAAAGFIIKGQQDDIKRLEADLKELPNVYARRDDVKEGFKEIKEMLQQLDNRWSQNVK